MTDLLLEALQNTKVYDNFDLNYALICAQLANQAYNPVDQQTELLSGYGFTDIKIVTNHNAHVTFACYGNDLYIAIMGTDFSNTQDLINNADTTWSNEGAGKVHTGYQKHLGLLWPAIQAYISQFQNKKIIITGHSMGGACGQIANYRLPGSIGYYFGSPRVVNSGIQLNSKALVYHIQNKYDIAPDLPPEIFGFELLGTIYTIRSGVLSQKQSRWYNIAYCIFYTIAYFGIVGYTKCFGGEDQLSDLILINHEIDDYICNIENILQINSQANQQ